MRPGREAAVAVARKTKSGSTGTTVITTAVGKTVGGMIATEIKRDHTRVETMELEIEMGKTDVIGRKLDIGVMDMVEEKMRKGELIVHGHGLDLARSIGGRDGVETPAKTRIAVSQKVIRKVAQIVIAIVEETQVVAKEVKKNPKLVDLPGRGMNHRPRKKDKKSSSSRSDRKSEKTDRGREKGHKEKSKSRKRSNKGGADEEIKLPKPKPPSNLVPLGPITNIKIALKTKIDEEKDYFAFHNHLRLYLYRSSGRCFEDLSSDETHEAFQRFCDKYNQGELEKSFYDAELPEEAMEQCKRTKHAWKFKTSVAEEKSLNVIKSGVKLQTQYDVKPPTAPARDGINRCMPAVQGNARVFPSSTSRRQVVAPRNDAAMTTSVPIAPARTKPVVPKVDSEKVAMLKRLGLSGLVKPGQKITIAPRK